MRVVRFYVSRRPPCPPRRPQPRGPIVFPAGPQPPAPERTGCCRTSTNTITNTTTNTQSPTHNHKHIHKHIHKHTITNTIQTQLQTHNHNRNHKHTTSSTTTSTFTITQSQTHSHKHNHKHTITITTHNHKDRPLIEDLRCSLEFHDISKRCVNHVERRPHERKQDCGRQLAIQFVNP